MTQPMIICGVDVGGSKIACGLFHCDNKALRERGTPARIKTREAVAPDPKQANVSLCKAVLGLVVDQLSALSRVERALVKGVGIGCCGIIDQSSGILRYANKLPGVRDLPFARFLEHRLRQFEPLQDIHVAVENDANAAGLAEALQGSGKGCREVVYLTISTGIGGVLVSNGKLQRGSTGKAGEFGSLYLGNDVNPVDPKQAVWSKLAGGKAIAERVVKLATDPDKNKRRFLRFTQLASEHPEKLDVPLLAECARTGDSECKLLFEETGRTIGIGITNLIDLYDPECIVIGGGMIKAFDLWSTAMFDFLLLRKPSLPPQMIRTARLGDMVGPMGAAAVCSAELFALKENGKSARTKEIAEVQSTSTPRKLYA